MEGSPRRIPAVELQGWAAQVFESSGVPAEHATWAAETLVAANLRGVDSHGVVRLPLNIRRLRQGAINPRPDVRIVNQSPAAILLEGDNGMGLVTGTLAMREAVRRAREAGTAAVSVRHSNHFGAAAHYVQMAAAADLIGLSFTNTDAGMAPWGSVTAFLGTNPLAFAAPGGLDGGIVVDMATSQVAWGKVMLAARAGEKIPLGWATDRAGRPTDDAQVGVKGLMLPLGGYKGYGLALMIEILCGVLSGSAVGPRVADDGVQPYRPQDAGHFFVAIDVARFMPIAEFKARMAQMVEEIHACQPAEGVERIYVPGEIEAETAARRRREGIPLPSDLVDDLAQLGQEIGHPFPQ